jgi:hypothetical protein
MFAQKKDWDELLPLAEFEYNNSKHSGTKYSPFYSNYGINPRSTWLISKKQSTNPASELYTHYLENTHKKLKENLLRAQAKMKATQNSQEKDSKRNPRYGQPHPDFQIGDEVLLDTRNLKREKLDSRKAGPFKISWVGRRACKIEPIPPGYHDVFNVDLLTKYNRGPNAPPAVELPQLKDNEAHYEPQKWL